MKGLKKQRRIQIVLIAAAAIALSSVLVGYAMRDGINFFRTPTQVVDKPPPPHETFRIGGLVETGSLVRGQGATVTFKITDTNASVPVAFTGVLPDLFGEGEGAVALGNLVDGVFVASEVLARHDETYMPREVVDALKEHGYYKEPQAAYGPAGGS
jgi:cytochrome c-type biogenesis protein CcmE